MMVKRSKGKYSGRISLFLSLLIVSGWFFYPATRAPADEIDLILKEAKKFSQAELQAIKNRLLNAEADGIPLSLLTPRLQEGIAKQIPAGRLQLALAKEIDLFQHARQLLSEVDKTLILNDLVWQHTAHALAWGMSREELATILKACSSERLFSYPKATALFISLSKWGINRETTLKLTAAVVLSALPEEQWTALLVILIKGRRLMLTPEKLSERILSLLPQVKTIHELEEKVLHE